MDAGLLPSETDVMNSNMSINTSTSFQFVDVARVQEVHGLVPNNLAT